MWLLLGRWNPNLSVSVLEVKRSLCRVTAVVGTRYENSVGWEYKCCRVDSVVSSAKSGAQHWSGETIELSLWNTCREVFSPLVFPGVFEMTLKRKMTKWVPMQSFYLLFRCFVFFLTFPLQTRNYWAQTKFQHHAQYPDNSAGSCSGYPAVSTLLGVLRKNIRQLYSMKKNIFQSVWTSASCRGCSVQCGEGTVVQCIVCMALCLRDNWPGKCKSHRSIYVYL